jgi:hypothetical protein
LTVLRSSGALVGICFCGWLVMALAGVVGLPPGWTVGLAVAAGIAMAAVASWFCRERAGDWQLGMILTCAFLVGVGLFIAVPLTLLAANGRAATATVVAEEHVTSHGRGGTRHEWRYHLVTDDGQPIPGLLVEAEDSLSAGDRVDVVYDPAGRTDPQDPWMLDARMTIWWITAGLAALTVVGGLAASVWSTNERRLQRAARSRPDRTWFRPLGRKRRIIGRTWLVAGVAITVPSLIVGVTSADDMWDALAKLGLILGLSITLLSLGPAFGRDNRTE